MMMRLQKYNLEVIHKAGKEMHIADMLSRAYLSIKPETMDTRQVQVFSLTPEEEDLFEDIASVNHIALENVSMSDQSANLVRGNTASDPGLQTLMETVITGWPDTRDEVPISIREYFNFREEITVQDGILFKGQCVIIPKSLRPLMISKTHESHLGQDACVRRARYVLYWPNMAAEIKDEVATKLAMSIKLGRQKSEWCHILFNNYNDRQCHKIYLS